MHIRKSLYLNPFACFPEYFCCKYKPSRFIKKSVIGLAIPMAIGLGGCQAVKYDLRNLQQPVVLNRNPWLVGKGAPALKLVDFDTYEARVDRSSETSGSSNTTTTSEHQTNTAQANAFAKIGGRTDAAIHEVTVEADALAVNALLALGELVSIKAKGKVAEVKPIAPAAASETPAQESQPGNANMLPSVPSAPAEPVGGK